MPPASIWISPGSHSMPCGVDGLAVARDHHAAPTPWAVSATGRAEATSARPPVLAKGTASEATCRTEGRRHGGADDSPRSGPRSKALLNDA